MRDPSDVLTEAVDGYVKQIAIRRGVSLARMYQLLGAECVYSKSKRLIADIAGVNPEGAHLIKADMMAFFDSILGPESGEVGIAELNKELHEAVQAKLERKPRSTRLKEDREAVAVLNKDIQSLEKEHNIVSIRPGENHKRRAASR
jgi:hypothetical protein